MDNLKSSVSCMVVIHGVPIDYLFIEVDGNCNDNYDSRKEKLKNCILLSVNQFKLDSALLYQLYIQYIGTEGHGYNIVQKYSRTSNGYNLNRDFYGQYREKLTWPIKQLNPIRTLRP